METINKITLFGNLDFNKIVANQRSIKQMDKLKYFIKKILFMNRE